MFSKFIKKLNKDVPILYNFKYNIATAIVVNDSEDDMYLITCTPHTISVHKGYCMSVPYTDEVNKLTDVYIASYSSGCWDWDGKPADGEVAKEILTIHALMWKTVEEKYKLNLEKYAPIEAFRKVISRGNLYMDATLQKSKSKDFPLYFAACPSKFYMKMSSVSGLKMISVYEPKHSMLLLRVAYFDPYDPIVEVVDNVEIPYCDIRCFAQSVDTYSKKGGPANG